MNNLTRLTVAEALKGLENKEFTSSDLVLAYAKNIKEKNENINAYVLETINTAEEQAKISDEKYAKGENSALEGLPIGIKDLFCTKGVRTTSCSNILYNFVPEYESFVTEKLQKEGVSSLGKLNMDEFAMGGSTTNSYFGNTVNPWNITGQYIAGGSSGGSAAAVAADMCIAALGSDTGGSVRQPASFCGVVGLKPTYGRCSRHGIIGYASSLDNAGVLAKTVEDAAIIMENMMGYDKRDSTSLNLPVPNLTELLGKDIKGMKIGIPVEYLNLKYSKDVSEFWKKTQDMLVSLGAEVVEVSIPSLVHSASIYAVIAFSEAASNLSKFDGIRYGLRVEDNSLDNLYIKSRSEGFGKNVKKRVIMGTYFLSADCYQKFFVKAQRIRHLLKEEFDKAFEQCDAILSPITQSSAGKIGKRISQEESTVDDMLAVPANLAGIPAISIPVGLTSDDMPVGMQLMTQSLEEAKLLQIANAIEKEVKFERKLS